MIQKSIFDLDGKQVQITYSDSSFRIRKIGTQEVYDDAVDVLESTAQYEETDELIPVPEQ